MNTQDFKTKTILQDRRNPYPDQLPFWGIGLDVGYSAVKGISPNRLFSFPSYARKIDGSRMTFRESRPSDLFYRDENGETWAVGELAYKEINANERLDSEMELYGRNRYFSPLFLVISRVGLALGLLPNEYGAPGDRKVKVQTGLPSKYMADEAMIRETLSGHHAFEIRIGSGPWTKFEFDLDNQDVFSSTSCDVFVMPQPIGSLLSVCIGADGKQLPIARNIFSSKAIVFDPGFGTLDDYLINNGSVDERASNTFPEYGMCEVFNRTRRDIKKIYHTEVTLPEFQNILVTGKVSVIDIHRMRRVMYPIDDLLQKNSKEVCMEAVEKMKVVHNYFADIQYIIAAGGTYDAWKDDFNKVFQDMEGLSIVPGNVNVPDISNIFSNVRGYYFYLINMLSRLKG